MRTRRLTRREFLGASLLTTGAAVFGCAPQPAAPAQPRAQEETPRYGGVLTAYLETDPPNFDLHQNSSWVALHPVAPCYNQLVQFDPHDHTKIIPDLADRWEVSPDGRTYTFYLKRGVKFHHGKPFKAEDVKASFERIIWPPRGVVSLRREAFAAVESIETPDDYTVKFVLKRPSPSLLPNIAQGWNAIFPKDILDGKGDMKSEIVGTGPFKLKSYVRGVSIELVKNPEYHVEGRPYLDGIKFYIIPDPNTAMSALLTGQLLIFRPYFVPDLTAITGQAAAEVAVERTVGTLARVVYLNARVKPWDDPRVRLAASLAIDRDEAVKVLTKGNGAVGSIMHPTGQWALPKEELARIPGFGPDKAAEREQAKRLLAEAGYPNGFKTRILARKGAGWEDQAVFIKDQWAKVGIDATLDVQELAVRTDRLNRRDFEVEASGGYAVSLDDPDLVFGQSWTCNAARNYSNACDPELDAMFERQSATTDPQQRRTIVLDMQRRALQQNIHLFLFWDADWALYWRKVRNFKLLSNRYLTERNEHIWLAES